MSLLPDLTYSLQQLSLLNKSNANPKKKTKAEKKNAQNDIMSVWKVETSIYLE